MHTVWALNPVLPCGITVRPIACGGQGSGEERSQKSEKPHTTTSSSSSIPLRCGSYYLREERLSIDRIGNIHQEILITVRKKGLGRDFIPRIHKSTRTRLPKRRNAKGPRACDADVDLW